MDREHEAIQASSSPPRWNAVEHHGLVDFGPHVVRQNVFPILINFLAKFFLKN